MALVATPVEGIELDNADAQNPNPGLKSGRKWRAHGQTGNTPAGNVANKSIGTVALPALNAGVVGTVDVVDGILNNNATLLFLCARNANADATASRGVLVWVESWPTSNTFRIGYVSPLANMAGAWSCHYWGIN